MVREDERGPTNQVDALENRVWVGGNKVPTIKGFLPVDLLRKGDGVANLVVSSLARKRVERPPLFRGNAESSCTRDLAGSGSFVPHLTLTATAWLAGDGGYPYDCAYVKAAALEVQAPVAGIISWRWEAVIKGQAPVAGSAELKAPASVPCLWKVALEAKAPVASIAL